MPVTVDSWAPPWPHRENAIDDPHERLVGQPGLVGQSTQRRRRSRIPAVRRGAGVCQRPGVLPLAAYHDFVGAGSVVQPFARLVWPQKEDVFRCGDLSPAGQPPTELQRRATQQSAGPADREELVVLTHRICHQCPLQGSLEALQLVSGKPCPGLVGGCLSCRASSCWRRGSKPMASWSRTRASIRSGRSSSDGSASS